MALTKSQRAARKGKLTASRISVLMTGDAQGILDLWREMTDDPTWAPTDLSDVWPVRLGECTEPLNLEWYNRAYGRDVLTRHGEVVQHPTLPWAACTLDAWDSALECPVEAKMVGGREPLEIIIERYAPQMQWQMECTGATQCALSVIFGTNAPIIEYLDRDQAYIDEMVTRGKQFMQHVEKRTPPVVLPPVPAPTMAHRIIDMSASNAWGENAFTWLENKPAAEKCKEAEKLLKALVPDDAKKAFGHKVRITRDRAGRLSLREDVAQ